MITIVLPIVYMSFSNTIDKSIVSESLLDLTLDLTSLDLTPYSDDESNITYWSSGAIITDVLASDKMMSERTNFKVRIENCATQ